jgi:hypothetical protein
LDEKPELFFVLRNMEMNDLITKAMHSKSKKMLKKAKKKSERVIMDNDLSGIFDIDMATPIKENIVVVKNRIGKQSKE